MFISGPQRKKVGKTVPQSPRGELIKADKNVLNVYLPGVLKRGLLIVL